MIYFIQAAKGGPIKIGLARDVPARRNELQTAHYNELITLAVFPGTQHHETLLHNQFARHHIRGEWYKPSAAIKTFIRRLANPCWSVQLRGGRLVVGPAPKEEPVRKPRKKKRRKKPGNGRMCVVAANIPTRVTRIFRAEAREAGRAISSVIAEALAAGRPDLPWSVKEGMGAPHARG